MTHILVVANRTAATQRLLTAVEHRAAEAPCRFTLLVPDLARGAESDWSDETAQRLLGKAAGSPVGVVTGGPDPFVAVKEAVATGAYDEIIVSTLPRGISKWLRRDLLGRVRGLGLPVTTIIPGEHPRKSLDDWAMDSIDLNRQAFHTASRGSGAEDSG